MTKCPFIPLFTYPLKILSFFHEANLESCPDSPQTSLPVCHPKASMASTQTSRIIETREMENGSTVSTAASAIDVDSSSDSHRSSESRHMLSHQGPSFSVSPASPDLYSQNLLTLPLTVVPWAERPLHSNPETMPPATSKEAEAEEKLWRNHLYNRQLLGNLCKGLSRWLITSIILGIIAGTLLGYSKVEAMSQMQKTIFSTVLNGLLLCLSLNLVVRYHAPISCVINVLTDANSRR